MRVVLRSLVLLPPRRKLGESDPRPAEQVRRSWFSNSPSGGHFHPEQSYIREYDHQLYPRTRDPLFIVNESREVLCGLQRKTVACSLGGAGNEVGTSSTTSVEGP